MKIHEIASFLASAEPAERLRGLQELQQIGAPVPLLVHAIHGCHPAVRETLLGWVAQHGKPVVAQALGQLLESDAPHPESAIFYLSLVSDPAYNGLLLSELPRSPEPIQVGMLHVLARTMDASTEIALAPMGQHLASGARSALERILQKKPAPSVKPAVIKEDAPAYANFPVEEARKRSDALDDLGVVKAEARLAGDDSGAARQLDLEESMRPEAVSRRPAQGDRGLEAASEPGRGGPAAPKPTLRERLALRRRQRSAAEASGRALAFLRSFGGLLLWLAALTPLGLAAWESAALSTPLKWAPSAAFGAALLTGLLFWRRWSHLDRAALSGIGLAGSVAFALLQAPPDAEAFRLLGRGAGFWGNALCLASLAVMTFAALAQREWPRAARLSAVALCAYAALGFVRAMAQGTPFELALLGGASLPEVPYELLQPPAVLINGLLPAALLLSLLHGLRGTSRRGWAGPAGALLFLSIPFTACSRVMETHLLPTPWTLACGRTVGAGFTGAEYTSAWDVSESGSAKHRVDVTTRGFVPGSRRRAYELAATVAPAAAAGKQAELLVTVRENRLGVPVTRLVTGDLEVHEDGEKQQVLSMVPEQAGGQPAYRITYVKALPPPVAVTLTSPAPGTTVAGVLNITAESDRPSTRLELFVDREPIAAFDQPPYRATEPAEAFSAGKHVVRAVARDRYGRVSESVAEVLVKHSIPDLAIVSPAEGSAIWGDTRLEATVAGVQAEKVELMIDGAVVKGFGGAAGPVQIASADLESTHLPAEASVRGDGTKVYSTSCNVRSLPEGFHRFGLRVTTKDGRLLEKKISARVVRPIVSVRMVTPQWRARLSGKVPLVAEAAASWPELPLSRVEFHVNGRRIGSADKPPYVFEWDTSGWAAGRYRVDAVATAVNGEVGNAAVSVEVAKPESALTIEGLYDGMTLAGPCDGKLVLAGSAAKQVRRIACTMNGQLLASGATAPLPFRVDASGDSEAVLAAEAVLADGRKLGRAIRLKLAASKAARTRLTPLRYGVPAALEPALTPRVTVDGKVATGVELAPAAGPTSYAFVVDTSASMAAGERQGLIAQAIVQFASTLNEGDRVALVAFNDEVTVAKPFSEDSAGLEEVLTSLRAYGATALNDAVFRAVELLGEERGRRVAIVVTDGVDQNIDWTGPASARVLPEVIALAQSRSVAVHTIGLGRELQQEGGLGERALARLAAGTGGSARCVPWPRDLVGAFAELARSLSLEMELTWQSAGGWGERAQAVSVAWPGRPDLTARLAPVAWGL